MYIRTKQCRKSGHTKSHKLNVEQVNSCILIYLHIPSYNFIHLHIPPNSFIHSYTPTYIKILNIGQIRSNIKHKKGHNSSPRASPRVQIQPT